MSESLNGLLSGLLTEAQVKAFKAAVVLDGESLVFDENELWVERGDSSVRTWMLGDRRVKVLVAKRPIRQTEFYRMAMSMTSSFRVIIEIGRARFTSKPPSGN